MRYAKILGNRNDIHKLPCNNQQTLSTGFCESGIFLLMSSWFILIKDSFCHFRDLGSQWWEHRV